MPCGWGGNHRSGVALTMRHGLQWFIQILAHGQRKGDEHPDYTHHGLITLFFYLHRTDGLRCSYSSPRVIKRFHWRRGARFTKYLTIYRTIIYFKFIVRSTYDSNLQRAKISLRNIAIYIIYEHYLRRSYDFASESS